MYIPACPITEANAAYVARQKNDFVAGIPPPDFPGGKGESDHVGRATEADLRGLTNQLGLRAFGFGEWHLNEGGLSHGQRQVLEKANQILSV